jgi:hypothetical protein
MRNGHASGLSEGGQRTMIMVLHFFKSYYPETMGGIEQVIFQIAEGGTTHGFESEVLYLSERGARA